MTKEISEKQREQQHLDHVLDLINDKEKELKSSIKSAEGEARDINSHFFDDVKLDYDGYSTSMETALSIHQQQQLLREIPRFHLQGPYTSSCASIFFRRSSFAR